MTPPSLSVAAGRTHPILQAERGTHRGRERERGVEAHTPFSLRTAEQVSHFDIQIRS